MKTLMMVIFVIGYILSVLRSLTDKLTAGAAALGISGKGCRKSG